MNPAPKKIPNRAAKVKILMQLQRYNCAIADSMGIYSDPHELHHAGVPNTKINRKLYPLLIHSIWNLKIVNHWLHMTHGSFGRMSVREARSREAFLEAHPCIAKRLNMEV